MSSLNLTPFLKKVLKPGWGGTRNKTHGSPNIHTGIVHRGATAFGASCWPALSIKNRPDIVALKVGRNNVPCLIHQEARPGRSEAGFYVSALLALWFPLIDLVLQDPD
jgi:hypothetical protein